MLFKQALLSSLKDGMKAEMDSVTLYKSAGENTHDEEVKEFFMERMHEEQRHFNYLLDYYHQVSNDQEPSAFISKEPELHSELSPVISGEFIRRIGENQVLFSAISTAVLLEKNAIEFYQTCRDEAEIVALRDFFSLLVRWEAVHYEDVLKIQREAEETYWRINRFEPF